MGGASNDAEAESGTFEGRHSESRLLRGDLERAYRLGERDFSNRELGGISLAATTLDGVALAGSSMRRADLSHATLSRADLAGADLRDANFEQALLVEANLSGVQAARARFAAARLTRARLTGSKAEEASFAGAELLEAQAGESDFEAADFEGADATRATFSSANLRGANLARATLVDANLAGADLRNASLRGADLSRADLRGALLSGADFARARFGGAHVPDESVPFARELERLAEIVGQARVALATLLGVCAYVLLTTATTTDAQLALNRARMTLPLVEAELPLQQFFVGAAVVTFVISCYLHLHQARMVRALQKFPQVFPDGSLLADRVSPWLVAVALSSWFSDDAPGSSGSELRSSRLRRVMAALTDLGLWTRLAAFTLLWGLAPFTIFVLLLRFMASQRAVQSYALWALLASAAAASWLSFLAARRARGRAFDKRAGVATVGISMALLACAPGVLMGIYPFHVIAPREKLSTFADGQVVGADLDKAPLLFADLRLSRLDGASLWGARLDGANLTGANLSGAHAQLASFEGADLSLADLAGALLSKARMQHARLDGARLQRVDMRWASFQHSTARGADMSLARAESTRFDLAVLTSARLRNIQAVQAVFEGADLEGADLSEANLQGANLRSTRLAGALFAKTDVSQVDFTGSMDLTPGQVCAMKGWVSALLPGDEAPDTRRPFRIEEAGPLRKTAHQLCPTPSGD